MGNLQIHKSRNIRNPLKSEKLNLIKCQMWLLLYALQEVNYTEDNIQAHVMLLYGD